MNAPWGANTQRLNCKIRPDIKAALEDLAEKWRRAEGGHVGLTRVIYEAAMMLLRREGIDIASEPPERPVTPVARRKRAIA
jgi:hypothetical protein